MNRLAFITGASDGIGLEFAKALHERGCNVLLSARRESLLKDICENFNSTRPGSADFISADLSDPSELRNLEGRISKLQITHFINNAGFGSCGSFDDLPIERETEMALVNVVAFLRLTHLVAIGMKRQRHGYIVNVSSIVGFQPLPYMGTYSATKAFNLYHSMALYHELKPHGITVTALCPGPTSTGFREAAKMKNAMKSLRSDRAADVVRNCLMALDNGQPICIPTTKSWLLSLPARLLPFRWTSAIGAKIMLSSFVK